MSEIRELTDTELDAVCGGHHGYHGRAELPHPALGQDFTPHGHHGNQGHFGFGNIGEFNFGNIVIQENIAEQVGVAVGSNASVTNLLGGQLNSSSIAGNIGDFNLGNFGNIGNIVNFGNIVIQENIVEQVGVAVGGDASVTNLLGGQLNSSSIA